MSQHARRKEATEGAKKYLEGSIEQLIQKMALKLHQKIASCREIFSSIVHANFIHTLARKGRYRLPADLSKHVGDLNMLQSGIPRLVTQSTLNK